MKPRSPGTVYYVEFKGLNPGLVGRRQAEESARQGAESSRDRPNREQEASLAPGRRMSDTYSLKEVSRLFDLTESRLRYWDRSGFLSPSGKEGGRRAYTFQDLIGIRSVKTLLDKGVSLQKTRKILEALQDKIPSSSHPIDRLRIMSDLKTVIVVDEEHEFEADTGQILLDFTVSDFKKEIVSELPSPEDKAERSAYDWYLEGCRLDEDEGTLKEAEEAYHRAIHLDPTLANAYTNLGNLLYRLGSTADAKVLYSKAIEVDPAQPEAHYNLGFLEFEQGNLQKAADSFLRAVEIDSTFADAHFNVAITLFRLGRHEKARYHLQSYLKIEPTGPWAEIAKKRLEDITS